jgi:hypothetical protein
MSTVSHWLPSIIILPEEDLPMTMQIAMIGADGIILASDTKVTTPWSGRRYGVILDERGGSKIRISPSGTMAISCAGDMNRADEVALKIISEVGQEETNMQAKISGIVSSYPNTHFFECLVASLLPNPQLLHVLCTPVKDEEGTGMFVFSVTDRVCSGDQANPAKFWHLRYYERSRSISALLPLAAQLIVDAAYLNTQSVGGLGLHDIRGESEEYVGTNLRANL